MDPFENRPAHNSSRQDQLAQNSTEKERKQVQCTLSKRSEKHYYPHASKFKVFCERNVYPLEIKGKKVINLDGYSCVEKIQNTDEYRTINMHSSSSLINQDEEISINVIENMVKNKYKELHFPEEYKTRLYNCLRYLGSEQDKKTRWDSYQLVSYLIFGKVFSNLCDFLICMDEHDYIEAHETYYYPGDIIRCDNPNLITDEGFDHNDAVLCWVFCISNDLFILKIGDQKSDSINIVDKSELLRYVEGKKEYLTCFRKRVNLSLLPKEEFYDGNTPKKRVIYPIMCKEKKIVNWDGSCYIERKDGCYTLEDEKMITYPAPYELLKQGEKITIDIIEQSTLSEECKERIYACFCRPLSEIDSSISWKSFQFAAYIVFGKIHKGIALFLDFLNNNFRAVRLSNESQLKEGDMIRVVDPNQEEYGKTSNKYYNAWAVYIGDGLFLRKHGKRQSGSIEIVDFEEMNRSRLHDQQYLEVLTKNKSFFARMYEWLPSLPSFFPFATKK